VRRVARPGERAAVTVNSATVLAMLDKAVARQLRRAANQIAEGLAERDRLIVEAHQAGATQREIAEHAGITHVAVHKIIHRNT
jgi:DNA-directed RNA polymerase specialized sigma subunit